MLARRTLFGLLAATPFLPHASRASTGTLRIGYQKNGTFLILRHQQRLEASLGGRGLAVQWLEFPSGPPLLEAMNAGAIDVGATGDTPPIFAQAAGVEFVYFAYQPGRGRNIAVLVPGGSPIRDAAELKGRRVAFTKGSAAHYATIRILAAAGLTLADIQPVYLQPADASAAFRNGSVDAWTIWDPFYALAVRDPAIRVLPTGNAGAFDSFLLARRDYAERNPDLLAALVGEFNTAAQWAGTHEEELARITAEVTGVEIVAQRVASARAEYHAAFLTDAVVARQQEEADAFFALRVIPRRIEVRAAIWTPPSETASAGAKP